MREQIQAIVTALDFIEDHLIEPITVADIAAAAEYSLYHFIRTFNQIVQHTPYDYLMRRRLSEAARELQGTDRRVIDIALDFQFNNHETFTRAFGRIFGIPPTHWRERGWSDDRYLMPALDRNFLKYLNSPDFKPLQLVALDEIILAGLMSPFSADPENYSFLWENLRMILRGLSLGPAARDFWGVRIQPQIPGGSSFYLAAFKIPSLETAPSTLVTKIIPAMDYICLTQPDSTADLDLGRMYLYHTFLPKSDYALAEPLEIEHFGEQREILIPVMEPKINPHSSKKLIQE